MKNRRTLAILAGPILALSVAFLWQMGRPGEPTAATAPSSIQLRSNFEELERLANSRSVAERPPVASDLGRQAAAAQEAATRQTALAQARQDIAWHKAAPEPAAAAFRGWTERYLSAPANEKKALAGEGRALAEARRTEFGRLMKENPARALELAVPVTVRRGLPAEVLEQLEKPLDTMGGIEHLAMLPPRDADKSFEPDRYFVVVSGKRIRAYVTQEREGQLTLERTPLSGYLLDQSVVLRPTAGRLLEPIEVAEVHASQGPAVCPISKDNTQINNDEAGLRVGDTTNLFCSLAHAASELQTRTEAEQNPEADGVNGPTSSDAKTLDAGSGASYNVSRSTGVKKVLIIRVDFPDQTTVPVSVANANAAIGNLRTKWNLWSDGRCTVDVNSTVTAEVFRLPRTTADYNGDSLAMYDDAVAAAAAYDPNSCHLVMIAMDDATPGFTAPGWAWVGTKKSFYRSWDTVAEISRIVFHELGHCIGLNHSKSYTVANPNPVADGGSYSDYGDTYDIMGSGDYQDAYNLHCKLFLGWIDAVDFPAVTASGVYRVAAHDKAGATGVRGVGSPGTELEFAL